MTLCNDLHQWYCYAWKLYDALRTVQDGKTQHQLLMKALQNAYNIGANTAVQAQNEPKPL